MRTVARNVSSITRAACARVCMRASALSRIYVSAVVSTRLVRTVYALYALYAHTRHPTPNTKKSMIHISWLQVLKLPTSDSWK